MLFRKNNLKAIKYFCNLYFENNKNIDLKFKHVNFLEKYHIPFDNKDLNTMLKVLNENDVNEFLDKVIPKDIKIENFNSKFFKDPVDLNLMLIEFKKMMDKNKKYKCYIGQGFYPTFIPEIIKRCVLENPAWYTAYTPYQGEISQGRLETLFNFQILIKRLTGLEMSNSSLLDECSSCCEAIIMAYNYHKGKKKTVLVEKGLFENSVQSIRSIIGQIDINIKFIKIEDLEKVNKDDVFSFIYQSPNKNGQILHNPILESMKNDKITLILATDLMSLVTLKPKVLPNICIGSAQRFGVAMGYGGPHAGFISCDSEFLRKLPGRIIGKSIDSNGDMCYRMTLQTREQHIKREKATSNICTAQALLANISAFYAIYYGEVGLKNISNRIRYLTKLFIYFLKNEYKFLENINIFDTAAIKLIDYQSSKKLYDYLISNEINVNIDNNILRISFDETKTLQDTFKWINIFKKYLNKEEINTNDYIDKTNLISINTEFDRNEAVFKDKDIFNKIKGEHELLRYITNLEKKDISLNKAMIPLGSCTMKLNSAYELSPLTWDTLDIHPFVENNQATGYLEMLNELADILIDITKMDCISFQSNSGATGEYLGLKAIKDYHLSRGDNNRNVCLIPSSAHGTNPASAKKIGFELVIIKSDENGNIDINDLLQQAEKHSKNLGAFMITYPSTHGVYEENIKKYMEIIHSNGGWVYLDGANLNAQLGYTAPGFIGADVCHLNLHKTFCIPHGGGGPGMGPICAKDHLRPFLPNHNFFKMDNFIKDNYKHLYVGEKYMESDLKGSISQSQFTSASILSISYLYIKGMGFEGMKNSGKYSILNANYVAHKLKDHYDILYKNKNNYNAHEFIIDIRKIKKKIGITEEDIAKRLLDYGIHGPTVSFPVHGTLMVEPTESENLEELNRFIEAMVMIRKEIQRIEDGYLDKTNNMLKNSPHTEKVIISDNWNYPYTRKEAAFPIEWIQERGKVWPATGRINNTYGDKNINWE